MSSKIIKKEDGKFYRVTEDEIRISDIIARIDTEILQAENAFANSQDIVAKQLRYQDEYTARKAALLIERQDTLDRYPEDTQENPVVPPVEE